jgi:hypothetical protein
VKQVEHSLRSAMGRRFAPAAKAAAAVALIGAALAACGAAPDGATPPARSNELAESRALVQTKVPPYYVALVASRPEYPSGCGCAPPTDVADVRATTTGALLAPVKPPRSYTFSAVSGAADDRTFVLFGEGPFRKTGMLGMYEYRSYSQRLFLLRIKPAASTSSARAELTTLPQTDIAPGQQVQAIALSPDGKSLAAILTRRVSGFPYLVSQLTIFNLSNGTQRTWTRDVCYYGKCVQGPIGDWPPIVGEPSRMQLSWTSGGRSLLFIEGSTGSQVRLLDVDAPGRNVVADSYPLPIRAGVTLWRDAVITPDAKSVFIGYNPLGGMQATLMHFTATTGKAAEVNHVLVALPLRPTGYGPDDVLWTNFNGSKFIVLGAKPGPKRGCAHHVFCPEPSGQTAGVYSGTQYTPLPWPANVVDAAW